MKRKELYDIEKKLHSVKQSGRTFTFIIAENKRLVSEAINEMEKQKEETVDFRKHLEETELLKKKFATKDHIGRPQMKPGQFPNGTQGMFYIIPGSEDPESEYRKALKELETSNRQVILDHDERERKYWEEYLEEELPKEKEVTFRRIKYAEVPKEISQDQMDAILFLIDYETSAKGDVR
jgi:hypothetical protein